MAITFFLITETNFHASYLITEWIKYFDAFPGFGGIAVREDAQSEETRYQQEKLHQEFQGYHDLPSAALEQFRKVYPNLSETDLAMIKLFGVPAHSVTFYPRTTFLSRNLNSQFAWQWLSGITNTAEPPVLFLFLDQLLQPWWIEHTHAQIINGHSAVLPYARGMYTIENIAITQDSKYFAKSAGATVHYIDNGIDTGSIIQTERLAEPFGFDSIWEVKAASFHIVFHLLIQTTLSMLDSQRIPIGSYADPAMRGPNFNSKDFTLEARKKAEEGYLKMKAEA